VQHVDDAYWIKRYTTVEVDGIRVEQMSRMDIVD